MLLSSLAGNVMFMITLSHLLSLSSSIPHSLILTSRCTKQHNFLNVIKLIIQPLHIYNICQQGPSGDIVYVAGAVDS